MTMTVPPNGNDVAADLTGLHQEISRLQEFLRDSAPIAIGRADGRLTPRTSGYGGPVMGRGIRQGDSSGAAHACSGAGGVRQSVLCPPVAASNATISPARKGWRDPH
jgi:hypothetical protein